MTETTAKNLNSQVHIRSATEADVPFIFNSWLKSYRSSNFCKAVSNPVYFEFQHKAIEKLLQRSQVFMLCSAEDESQVFGYIVCEEVEQIPILHYCYVKFAFRNMGLCNMLLKHAKLDKSKGGFYTHDTHAATKVFGKSKFVYNPYLAFT
jgi:hypothetical protein